MYIYTRSLGALRAPTSSWWPYGPALGLLDFVLRALRALRPCDPHRCISIMHVSMMHVSMMHVSMMHVSVMSNAGGVILRPNLQPIQVVPSDGKIQN